MSNTCILVHGKDCNMPLIKECIDSIFTHINPDSEELPVFATTEDDAYIDSRIYEQHSYLTGDGVWADRLRLILTWLKDAEYKHAIFFLEDMIVKNADKEMLQQAIDFHIAENNSITKLGKHPFFNTYDVGKTVGEYRAVYQQRQPYIISHQPVAIFNIEFFLKTIQDSVTPWEHEIRINEELSQGKFGEFKVCCLTKEPGMFGVPGMDCGEIIEYHHALTRGQAIEYRGKYK